MDRYEYAVWLIERGYVTDTNPDILAKKLEQVEEVKETKHVIANKEIDKSNGSTHI